MARRKLTQDPAIESAKIPVVSPPEAAIPIFAETLAERTKRRRRGQIDSAAPIEAPPTNKRVKFTTKSVSKADHKSQAPFTNGVDHTQSVLTLPRSDDGIIDVTQPDVRLSSKLAYTQSAQGEPVRVLRLKDREIISDATFAQETLLCLEARVPERLATVGDGQIRRTIQLLSIAEPATQEEGPQLSEEEVESYLKPGIYHDGPIFVKNQQPMPLMTVKELTDEFYNDEAGVWIQDPSMTDFSQSAREITIGEVKKRLSNDAPTFHPWNCLEMAAPFEDGLRPKFLNSEECRLLTKIKIPSPEPSAKVGRRILRRGYKEAEKWVLLAQAGALTEPHQDSHGFSTYITVNEGLLGYGWMSNPTAEERQNWVKSPHNFIKASWKYRVLRPGDTVYFPAGTVHFVFRHPDLGHTLAFGGHVLRCSTIIPWIQAIANEKTNNYISNEELTETVYGYLEQVGTFVKQALASTDSKMIERWGGAESIEAFLELKKGLELSSNNSKPKKRGKNKKR